MGSLRSSETTSKGTRECMDSCRTDVSEELGRYVATDRNPRSVATQRLSLARAAQRLSLARAAQRPSLARAWSLSSDRARRTIGRYVDRAGRILGRYVATVRPFSGFSLLSRVSSAELFVRINLLRRFIFRKNVHTDFYALSDIDSVVTDFDPNNIYYRFKRNITLLCYIIFINIKYKNNIQSFSICSACSQVCGQKYIIFTRFEQKKIQIYIKVLLFRRGVKLPKISYF